MIYFKFLYYTHIQFGAKQVSHIMEMSGIHRVNANKIVTQQTLLAQEKR